MGEFYYYENVAVPPTPRYCAEVVVLLTSLGANRAELSRGKRACNFFEIKRVHAKIIDYNRDVRESSGSDDDGVETAALEHLFSLNQELSSDSSDPILPLIFLDGRYIGSTSDLQALEDDGLLGRILRRELCLNCQEKRRPQDMMCSYCGTKYEEVLKGKMTIYQRLGKLAERTDVGNECSGSEAEERFTAYRAAQAKSTANSSRLKRRGHAAEYQKGVVRRRSLVASRALAAFQQLGNSFNSFSSDAATSEPDDVLDLDSRQSKSMAGYAPGAALTTAQGLESSPAMRLGQHVRLQGYLWKKIYSTIRLRNFKKRYVVLKGAELLWWSLKEEAEAEWHLGREGPACKGFIDLSANATQVELENTTFKLRPLNGSWAEGSTSKDDARRDFAFDACEAKHDGSKWVDELMAVLKVTRQDVWHKGSSGRASEMPRRWRSELRSRKTAAPPRLADVQSGASTAIDVVPDADFYLAVGLPVPPHLLS